ncbi:MAG: proline dehydrogenase family protein [Blastocatellia bacterium]
MMLSRTILLYLSRRHGLKNLLAQFGFTRRLTSRFIAGENIDDAIQAIRELNAAGVSATFDHLGESITARAETEAEVREYMRVLSRIAAAGIDSNVSLKLTQFGLDIDETLCLEKTRAIVAEAARLGNFVRLDMEDSAKTDATLRIFTALRREFDNVGIVIQAYLYRSEKDIEDMLALGARIRLCKGAYQEDEDVAWPGKKDVDDNYIRLMKRLLKSGIYHGLATHDLRMINATKQFAAAEGIPPEAYEFQMLYGVRRDLMLKLREEGFRVRAYVPYGAFWYPYFMRRLAERPANVWFLLKNSLKG